MNLKSTSILLSCLFILSSCATKVWVSDTKSPDELQRDISNCEDWAYSKFPVKMEQQISTSYKTIETSTNEFHTTKTTVPFNSIETVDVNSYPRKNAFNICMRENDWRLEIRK